MNKYLSKISSIVSRVLTNDLLALRVYQYWAAAAVLIIGIFGLYPGIKNLSQKVSLLSEMQQINKSLSYKAQRLSELEDVLLQTEEDAYLLQNYIPDNFDIQNYMVDFVISAAQADLLVDRFMPIKESDGVTEISINLVGDGNLLSLIKNLEEMERLTEISQATYFSEEGDDRVKLVTKVYSMKK